MSKDKIIRPCAIYVRVSTQMQADVGLSIESQIETLKKEAEKRGKPVYDIYADVKSGGTFKRPEFQRLLKDSQIKPPPFDLLLTWSVSRFGRNTMESYIATEKLRERDISIFYYKEPFDTEDSLGNLIIEILRAVAEFSRLEYVKDVERSKIHLAKCGYSTGGPPPFGFRRAEVNDNGYKRVKWEPDPVAAPIARKVFEMYADGKGFKSVCKWLNDNGIPTIRGGKWRSSSFSRMLRNEIYIGNVVYNKEEKKGVKNGNLRHQKDKDKWIRTDGAVEPIVPKEVFDRVQKRLQGKNRGTAQTERSQYLLSGLIKCNVCGLPYFGRTPKKTENGKVYVISQYICSKQNRYNTRRDNVNLKREWFDNLIVDRLFNRILSEVNIKQRIKNAKNELEEAIEERKSVIRKLNEEKNKIDGSLQKYYDAFEEGKLDPESLERRIKKHKVRLEEIDVEITDLKNEILLCQVRQNGETEKLLDVDFNMLGELFEALPVERKKQFMKAFIEKIVVDPKWFEIHYTLPTGMEVERIITETSGPDGGGNGSGENPDYLSNDAACLDTCKSSHLQRKSGVRATGARAKDDLLAGGGNKNALHPKPGGLQNRRANTGVIMNLPAPLNEKVRQHLSASDFHGEGGI